MIKTSRLVIQPYDILDKNAMIELLKNPIIKQNYIIPDFTSIREGEEYFLKLLRYSHSLQHYERGIYLNQKLIGFVNDVSIEDKTIEIGYVIHPDYHQQGTRQKCLKQSFSICLIMAMRKLYVALLNPIKLALG